MIIRGIANMCSAWFVDIRISICFTSCLPASPPARLPACLPARLPAHPPARLPACPPARLPAHPPACPPACLPTCLPAHLPACLPTKSDNMVQFNLNVTHMGSYMHVPVAILSACKISKFGTRMQFSCVHSCQ